MPADDAFINRVRELNASVDIRPARADDAKPFTELMNEQYSRKKKEEYFFWQFMDFVNPTRLFVAYDNDCFAGCYGIQVNMLSNSVPAGFTIDLLIREKYRNRALLVLFEEKARKFALEHGALVMTSLPNADGMRAHIGLKTWKHIGVIKTYSLVGPDINEKGAVTKRKRYEGDQVSFLKSAEYRKWRYELNPEHDYSYIELNTGEFAVTKLFRDPLTGAYYGDIVDFECSLHNQELLRELFLKACRHLRKKKVEAVTTWALPHTPLSAVVESLGFTETGPERYFCFKSLEPGREHGYDFSRWHLVQADSEIY